MKTARSITSTVTMRRNSSIRFWGGGKKIFPDVITGWNVQLFDIPYICRRMNRMLGDKYTKMLSPWKMVSDREIYIKGRKQIAYDIPGISCLDYLELYKKFTYTNQESYRLDHIAFVELEQKNLTTLSLIPSRNSILMTGTSLLNTTSMTCDW